MFPPMQINENEKLVLRPMNCPHHMLIFKRQIRSYRELPFKIAELGMMHRYEKSGALSGLQRVREMTLNDAHIFVRPDQIKEEFIRVIKLLMEVYNDFNITDFKFRLSLRDPDNKEKYFQDNEMWIKAETILVEVMKELEIQYSEAIGDAAFYGPKLDFMVKDALGRSWQLGTIQVDYNLPERFELEYKGSDNESHRPVMIHRAPFGSMERFVAVLLEHCGGNFPLWLTPEQVKILPVSEKYNDYAKEIAEFLEFSDIRALVDERNEKIGRKIRDAEVTKIPFMLIVGEKEATSGELSVRRHGEGDLGTMTREDFVKSIEDEISQLID